MSSLFSGPRLEAEVASGSYPVPAADGRLWKYAGSAAVTTLPSASFLGFPCTMTGRVNAWPIRADPTGLPTCDSIDPFAWEPRATCARPVIARG